MASLKVKFRESILAGTKGTIYYQIIHGRLTRQISTSYKLYSTEWDSEHSSPVLPSDRKRLVKVKKIIEMIRSDINRLSKIINHFDRQFLPYSAIDIVEEYKRYNGRYTVFRFMKAAISMFKERGSIRTAETYYATLRSFRKFRNNEDLMIDRVTADIVELYEAYLKKKKLMPNTISFYLRILRAVYNRAVEHGAVEQTFPFRHVYTGVDKTVKRALPANMIRYIRRLDLSKNPALDLARDIFILSFILRGMSFVDMAFLRKSDLRNGILTYRRRKTGQQLVIKWTSEMQDIIDKYPENQSQYLLPIIRRDSDRERSVYRYMSSRINHDLKIIAAMAGVTIPLTLYVARHSWASIARSKGIPLSIISEGMGHDTETTTQIYLATLDTSAIDRANSIIIKSI